MVHVEGPSDRDALAALLRPLREQKWQEGVDIQFFPEPSAGNNKRALVTKVPRKAVNTILFRNDTIVVALPDLYPRDVGFPHVTAQELISGIESRFEQALQAKQGTGFDARLKNRFRAFCIQYDLEALVLAAEEQLQVRLGAANLNRTWRMPVEDQNHNDPPKRVVERLFAQRGRKYVATVDAPLILGGADYTELAKRCPQSFKPFVDFLSGIPPAREGIRE